MNINELIMNGASEEEIAKAVAEAKYEKARKDEEARKAKEAKQTPNEVQKAEGRAYLINAVLSYAQAFGLLKEKDITPAYVEKMEDTIVKLEELMPMYIKLIEMQNEMDSRWGFLFGGDLD